MKFLLSLLILSLLPMAYIQYRFIRYAKHIREETVDDSRRLGAFATTESSLALKRQAELNLLQSVTDKAQQIDMVFDNIQKLVSMGTDFASRVFSHTRQINGRDIPSYYDTDTPPYTSFSEFYGTEVSYHASVIKLAPGIKPGKVRNEIRLSAALDGFFSSSSRHNQLLKWIYIGMESGIHRSYPWHAGYDPAYDARRREWYRTAVAGRKLVWSKPYEDATTGKLTITCSKPVYKNDGTLLGVMGADISIETVRKDILQVQDFETARMFLIDSKNRLIATSYHAYDFENVFKKEMVLQEDVWTEIAGDITAGESGLMEMQCGLEETDCSLMEGDLRCTSERRYVAYSPVATTNWAVGIVVSQDEITKAAARTKAVIDESIAKTEEKIFIQHQKMRFDFIKIFVIVILITVLLAYLLARMITKPIRRMAKDITAVGRGELEHKIVINSRDEIGLLADSFNKMTSNFSHLYNLSQEMSLLKNTDSLIKLILDRSVSALSACCGIVILVREDTGRLETRIVRDSSACPLDPFQMEVAERLSEDVLPIVSPLLVKNTAQDPWFKKHFAHRDESSTVRSLISVPLKCKEDIVGMMTILNRAKRESPYFGEDDVKVLEVMASHISHVIERGRLFELSIKDGLTGFFIPRYFKSRLEEELIRSRRYQINTGLLMIDIDDFKVLNDRYGHQAGDAALQQISSVVKKNIRSIDIAGRYGGDEFSIIVPEISVEELTQMAGRLKDSVAQHPIDTISPPSKATVSIGIAIFPNHAQTRAELVKHADEALYRAKHSGKNCVHFYQ